MLGQLIALVPSAAQREEFLLFYIRAVAIAPKLRGVEKGGFVDAEQNQQAEREGGSSS